MNNKNIPLKEKISWAMYDFANSGYATVVLTTIYNAWFVSAIAMAGGFESGQATFLWTLTFAIGNALILFTAPAVGAIADLFALRKRLLFISTLGCVVFTALLSVPREGDVALAMTLLVISYFMFASGENLIAAFLPELADQDSIGRLSGFGWALGFVGGLLTLALCLVYIKFAEANGHRPEQFIPVTLLIVALVFLVAALPTLIWLKERTPPAINVPDHVLRNAYSELRKTFHQLKQFPDLTRFMFSLTCFHGGIYIVIVLAAVYAEQVMGFDTEQNILLIGVVNITAAIGAFAFGIIQDKIGSVRTLMITLFLWCCAIILVWSSDDRTVFWIAANLIGMSLGASQSGSRALVGLFSPAGRYGEFFGLWGLCVKFAAIIGPISYGILNHLTHGDHKSSLLITLLFFIAGMILLAGVNEKRGRLHALQVTSD